MNIFTTEIIKFPLEYFQKITKSKHRHSQPEKFNDHVTIIIFKCIKYIANKPTYIQGQYNVRCIPLHK